MRRIAILRLASVAALALIPLGCNDLGTGPDRSDDPYTPTTGIEIKPEFASLAPGETFQLEVAVHGLFGTVPWNLSFIWESNDPWVAAVDSEGRVEALGPARPRSR